MRSCTRSGEDHRTQQEDTWRAYVESLRKKGGEQDFEEQWAAFQRIFAQREDEDGPPVVWTPNAIGRTQSNLDASMRALGFTSYADFYSWSVEDMDSFWRHVIDRLGIVWARPSETILDLTDGPQYPRWFAGARMNITDSCFSAPREQPAIISGSEVNEKLSTLTYGALERLVNRVANGIRDHGFGSEAAIGLFMPMTKECVSAYLGIIRAGCRVVSIADSFSPAEVKTRMRIAGARHIITVDDYVWAGKPIPVYAKVVEADIPTAVVIPSGPARSSLRKNDLLWDDFLSSDVSLPSVVGDPYKPLNILFSSGTTGEPKAIPWTHLTPLKCAMDGHYHQDIHRQDVVAWPTNIGWMMGPWLIYASLINGATMALYEGGPNTTGFARFIQQARVSILGVVPSLVRTWRIGGVTDQADWSGLRLFSSTGEPSNRYDYFWLMSRTGYQAPVIEYLGGTEIGGGHITGSVLQPASPATFTSPALGSKFVILDDAGQSVEEGGMGELFLVPPALGLSHTILNADHDPVYLDGCPAGPRGETLRRHGDQTLRLRHGFFRAQGRADDTMNLSGIKVSSLELERVIDSHEAVYESAAVAVQPEGEGPEKLVVFVVLTDKMDREILIDELKTIIRANLNPLFKIHDLVISPELPRTASNKLMRRKLRARYQRG